MIRESDTRAGLLVRVHQVEVVESKAQVDAQVSNRRKVILHIEAGLPALAPAAKRRKDIGVPAAVEEKAFPFAQPHEIDARLEEMSAPGLREVALYPQRERSAGRSRKRGDRVGRGENLVRTRALIERSLQQRLRRKRVQPSQDRRVLAQVPLCIAARCLVRGKIGLLKIGARAQQQKLEAVFIPGAPVELRRRS